MKTIPEMPNILQLEYQAVLPIMQGWTSPYIYLIIQFFQMLALATYIQLSIRYIKDIYIPLKKTIRVVITTVATMI